MSTINDIVLIHFEDTPLAFARIEDINPDVKKGWYKVKLLLLQVPLQVVVWILRDPYIDGAEFTMNGKRMRLVKVICPEDSDQEDSDQEQEESEEEEKKKIDEAQNDLSNPKVISFADFKRK